MNSVDLCFHDNNMLFMEISSFANMFTIMAITRLLKKVSENLDYKMCINRSQCKNHVLTL